MHEQVLTAAAEQLAGCFVHLWHRGTSNIKDLQIENRQGVEIKAVVVGGPRDHCWRQEFSQHPLAVVESLTSTALASEQLIAGLVLRGHSGPAGPHG